MRANGIADSRLTDHQVTGIIIAGGFGTRLRPLTYHRPKHLLPVGNRPFLEYQVALLKRHGIREIVFASNYLWEQIHAHFGDGAEFGVSMRYAIEPEPLGTAGAIRNAAEPAGSERLIVLNGDVLTDFDLSKIIGFHEERRADSTIALRAVQRPHAFGVLKTDPDGRVREWREPSEEEKKRVASGGGQADGQTDYINAGIYIFEPEVIQRIPTGRTVSVERETYQEAIAEGLRIFATAPEGYWLDIGNPRQYLAANQAVLAGEVRTDVQPMRIADTARIDPSARISADSTVGPGSIVRGGAVVETSVVLDEVVVGARSSIAGAIIDSRAEIADGASIGGVVIGKGEVVRM